MKGYLTPPRGRAISTRTAPELAVDGSQLASPISLKWESPKSKTPIRKEKVMTTRTQKDVDSNSTAKRLQQDLLILTSFNDNSSLYWRPAWSKEEHTSGRMWTLHNPPNVVTQPLPNAFGGMQMYTRRMRREDDHPQRYIKDWNHWMRYCDMYGIPQDFLCEDQVQLLRLGLPKTSDGSIRTPPHYPVYPEPSPQDSYMLAPAVCSTHLPRKFQQVAPKSGSRSARKRSAEALDEARDSSECVILEPDGKLSVVTREDSRLYLRAGKRYRWSYLPWTAEMEKSCRPLKLKVRLWNEARESKKARLAG